MSNIINRHEDFVSFVKNVILKYCPYTEDRLSILGRTESPELDIDFHIGDDKSQVVFIFGNHFFKSSVPEKVTTTYPISFEEISEVMDYLLEDHEVIKNLDFHNKTIDLKFAINWTDNSIKGIRCGDIGLNLDFENMELKTQYLYLLFQRYHSYLEHTSSFKTLKNKYFTSMKHSYFDDLEKHELISLLNGMSENELRELFYLLDNDLFIKYVIDDVEKPKERVLSLKEHHKNHNMV